MRADTHDGPEQNRSTSEALYIDAALTFVGLGTPSCNARPGHTFWHVSDLPFAVAYGRFWFESGLRLVIWRALKVPGRKEDDEAGRSRTRTTYRLPPNL